MNALEGTILRRLGACDVFCLFCPGPRAPRTQLERSNGQRSRKMKVGGIVASPLAICAQKRILLALGALSLWFV